MITKLKQTLTVLTITALLFAQAAPTAALEAPTPPPVPTLTSEATPPSSPEAPTAPSAPSVPTLESSAEPSPVPSDNLTEEVTPTPTSTEPEPASTSPDPTSTVSTNQSEPVSPNTTDSSNITQSEDPSNTISQTTGEQSEDGYVGDPKIITGDALNTATVTNSANNNTSTNTLSSDGSVGVINDNNGDDSQNSASLDNESSVTTIQDNNAEALNDLNLETTTGENSTSKNVGTSSIDTGDANTTANLTNFLNTNSAGIAVSEFNVVDDQNGDLILDLAAGCVLGCSIFGDTLVANTDNGSDSTNSAQLTQNSDSQTFQTNDALLENNLTLASNTGDNDASKNTGGDSTITTGDANTSANVINFLNNNIAGQVVLGIVNIFGDLIGDIILPGLETTTTTASNTDNGSGSDNTASIDQNTNTQTFQTNDAQIENNLILEATTGSNDASKNTGGSSTINTGEANIDSQTLNIANTNLTSGDWWLVLVNEAGEWVGKIIGADGTNYAGSEGTQFTVNSNGDITATNDGNGTDSQNTASVDQTANTTTVQSNVAKILNNINLFANTGGNSASKNTGGDSTITTGDANIVANLVNFVNNNIVGNGRLTVVTINVFGKWLGDFVGPGYQKERVDTVSSTNNNQEPNNNGSNSDNSNNTSQSASTNSTGGSNQVVAEVVKPLAQLITLGNSISGGNTSGGEGEVKGSSFEEVTTSNPQQIVTLTKGSQGETKAMTFNLALLLPLVPLLLILVLALRRLRNEMKGNL